MSRTATTWQLMKDSWRVLMRDKALMLFPALSGVACALVLIAFAAPFLGASLAGLGGSVRGERGAALYLVLFCYYLCNFFVVLFFNAALVNFVVTRLRGGEPTVAGSLRAAAACAPQLAAWAVVSSTVGVVLKALSNRSGIIGQIAISIVGFAWMLVTYFVVPIIVVERKGAFDSIGGSKDLLAKTWGRQIVSGLAYGLLGFLLALPIFLLIAAAVIALLQHGHVESVAAPLVAGIVYWIGVAIVMSTLRAIFGAVLYLFARTGEAPAGFSASDLIAAIQPAR